MNQETTGKLIVKFRKEKQLTQKQLADKMNISFQAVSKWERGIGSPDIALLTKLSDILGISTETLISGNEDLNEKGVNMKNLKFYVCSECGNVITSINDIAISCCGRKLIAQEAKKASVEEKLNIEKIENEYYITSEHDMTKEHYISFTALLTADKIILSKQYPEWNFSLRIPQIGHGKLVWYCNKHGLKYQII